MTSLFLGDDVLAETLAAADLEWPIDAKWSNSDVESLTSNTDELLESILRGSCQELAPPTLSDDGSEDSGLNVCSPSSDSADILLSDTVNNNNSNLRGSDDEEEKSHLLTADPSLITSNLLMPRMASPQQPIVVEVTPVQKRKNVTTILVPTVKAAGQSAQTKVTLMPVLKKRAAMDAEDEDLNKAKVAKNEDSEEEEKVSTDNHICNDKNQSSSNPRYPRLILSEEERRICERDSVRLPTHYPLSREEEKALKRVRRKIRNKVSAQDSRKRKKEYVDAMEDRVKICASENEQLHKKIEILEKQNRTLAGQLKRLHQLLVNGGVRSNNNSQTSTAMMVLLLSTALFLIPGMGNNGGRERESELELSQALKMPPLPGQSRSLLHFPDIVVTPKKEEVEEPFMALKGKDAPPGLHDDHDYSVGMDHNNRTRKRLLKTPDTHVADHVVKMEEGHVERRMINVTKGDRMGTRTVVLHVPKDIK